MNIIQKTLQPEDYKSARVLIADPETGFRKAVRRLLVSEREVEIVGETGDAEGVLASVSHLEPDVVLVDAELLVALKDRMDALGGVSLLVTVPKLDDAVVIRAFLQGAKAVVTKPSGPQIWTESIRTVVSGQYWLEKESIGILVAALRQYFLQNAETTLPRSYKLTPREVEIVSKIANGHTNKEVGKAFSIRERTVKHHLTNIFTKLGVSNRLELALFARNQLLMEGPLRREAVPNDELRGSESLQKVD